MSASRRLVLASAALTPALAAPSVARAQVRNWRMVTSWPKRLPGPGTSAERIAQRIRTLSGGRLVIQVFGAGEIVPAFGVLDAVGGGVAEMGHSAALFWQGKEPAAAFFTSVPFGLTPAEHGAWLASGGGQALWDEVYAPYGVKPFPGGNTGLSMGGWFRREVASLADVKGLRIRMVGLGAEVFNRMGATAIAMPPGDIYPALERGAIDAAEFTSPGADMQFTLWRIAPHYLAPGFTKPNGSSECLVNLKAFDSLESELKAVIAEACAAEAGVALAEMETLNMDALMVMVGQHGVRLNAFPDEVVAAARRHAADVVGELGGRGAGARKVVDSYTAFQRRLAPWTRLSLRSYLAARDG